MRERTFEVALEVLYTSYASKAAVISDHVIHNSSLKFRTRPKSPTTAENIQSHNSNTTTTSRQQPVLVIFVFIRSVILVMRTQSTTVLDHTRNRPQPESAACKAKKTLNGEQIWQTVRSWTTPYNLICSLIINAEMLSFALGYWHLILCKLFWLLD